MRWLCFFKKREGRQQKNEPLIFQLGWFLGEGFLFSSFIFGYVYSAVGAICSRGDFSKPIFKRKLEKEMVKHAETLVTFKKKTCVFFSRSFPKAKTKTDPCFPHFRTVFVNSSYLGPQDVTLQWCRSWCPSKKYEPAFPGRTPQPKQRNPRQRRQGLFKTHPVSVWVPDFLRVICYTQDTRNSTNECSIQKLDGLLVK